jgi:lipid intermediate transporter
MLTNTIAKNQIFDSRNLTIDLFQGFMLASIAKFFFLPIIIWRENMSGISSQVHLVIVITYFLISLIYIHAGVVGCSKKKSAVTILMSFMINKYIWFNIYFNRSL